jgi:hypothetical protein
VCRTKSEQTLSERRKARTDSDSPADMTTSRVTFSKVNNVIRERFKEEEWLMMPFVLRSLGALKLSSLLPTLTRQYVASVMQSSPFESNKFCRLVAMHKWRRADLAVLQR